MNNFENIPKKRSLVHSIRKCSRAHPDGVADLLWVEVVVDEPVDDGWQLGLHQGVALLLDRGPEKASQGVAELLEELHDLVLGGVAGDEVVEVGDDVDADGAGQLVPALGHGLGGRHEGGEEEEGCLHLASSLRSFSATSDDKVRKLWGFIATFTLVSSYQLTWR